MQTKLEQVIHLIHKMPLEDFDKLREIVDKEIVNRRNENEGKISPERALEVLRMFHDDFYNEAKDGFSQKELRNALGWVLAELDIPKNQE